ncbi:cysteine desulfurase family protein [Blastococcus sp. Marseille-P5729]|uniref:cysteine desulfurase family protein n=1 Tax=Blastococcus sp. Marseille-P5729 TaxID=2086582 RepID=UPI000D0F977D|nr:cysteine desulfurase family protein [Blastococcus sp. Marseille-P5729]
MSEVYLDHAATTVVRDSVIEVMAAALRETGNPSSLHAAGRRARRAIEEAREQIAETLGADPVEVIFTSGATEADNLAVKGGYWAARDANPARTAIALPPTEHHAVLDSAHWLAAREGATLRWVEVDQHGTAHPDVLAEALAGDDVAVAAVMWANNEVGTINDIPALAAICAERGVALHVDAVQAIGRAAVDFGGLPVTSLALSGHKIGGPVGVGALLAVRGFAPVPTAHGGGQERKIRSGTLDVAGAVGLATAVREAEAERVAERARLMTLRERIVREASGIGGVEVNGHAVDGAGTHPAIVNLHVPGADAESLLMLLDGEGVAISTGSACTAGVSEPSYVVLAMTGDDRRGRQSIRVSMGRTTTESDIERLLAALPLAAARARRATGYRGTRG